MGATITSVHARQLVDCKCRPMVEVDVRTSAGALGQGSSPTGSSVGMYESFVLRDNDPGEYRGLSVHKAVQSVNEKIAPALVGMDVADQRAIDQKMIELDGTPNKQNLGGNAVYSTSIACLRAAAAQAGKPLYEHLAGGPVKTVPIPSFNVVNGGRYAALTQPFNEFIVLPYKAKDVYQAVEIGILVFSELAGVIKDYAGSPARVGPSFGYEAPSDDPEVVLSLIEKAVERAGFAGKVAFALDCAASEMYDSATKTYLLHGQRVSSGEMIAYIKALSEKFPFVFIEDAFDENDWDAYAKAKKVVTATNLIGDDLIATNRQRLQKAYDMQAVDGFILKPNQIGTISEALDTYAFAQEHGLLAITSGRAGGVVDDVVMDLAVGLQVGFIKNGAPRSGERINKLNFLMRACESTPGCRLADISPLVRF